jgi:sporulation protein YlmC with PRC-barrel domain
VHKLEDFRLGAKVVSGDGHSVGTLVSVLVEQQGFDPKAVVVKHEESLVGRLMAAEKFFITDELVIPMTAVESAAHNLVRLSIPISEVRRQPPYISYRFKPVTFGALVLEEAELLGGGLGLPSNAEELANKPDSEIEIDRGENVMLGETGHRLGRIHEVVFDGGELIGVVIRPDGSFKKDVVLPIRFISRGDDLALFAQLDEADVARLRPLTETG